MKQIKTDALDPFDSHFQNWKAEQEQPWMDLRYRLADRFPYYLLARFYQIIAVKEQGDFLLGKLD